LLFSLTLVDKTHLLIITSSPLNNINRCNFWY